MKKKSVFLAISFTRKRKVEKAIINFFANKGFDVRTGRSMHSGKPIGDELKRLMTNCDFGVVVYNELRHNISYEWGLLDTYVDHVFLFKDCNIHIDLDTELSDKKGIVFTAFCGEDDEKEIIKSLEEDDGLMDTVKECISKSISQRQTEEVKQAAEAITDSEIPFGKFIEETKKTGKIKEEDLKRIIKSLGSIDQLSAEGHSYIATAYYYAKNYKNAIEELDKILKLDPKNAGAWYNKGVALSDLKRYEEAIEAYDKTIEIDPKKAEVWYNKGVALSDLKRYEEAIEAYDKTIEIEPKEAEAWNNKGNAFYGLKRYEEAIETYDKAIEIDPKKAEAWYNKGVALSSLKRYEEAIETYDKAIEIDSKKAEAWNNKGNVLYKLGKPEEAIKCFNKSLELNPKGVGNYQTISELYAVLGKYDESLKNAEKAEELSKEVGDKVVSMSLILITHILMDKKKDTKVFLEYLTSNEGYELTFEFETLKGYLKDSPHFDEIEKLISEIIKYSHKGD